MKKKSNITETLQGRFNIAAYKLDILSAQNLLPRKKESELLNDIDAIYRVLRAQEILEPASGAIYKKFVQNLNLPATRLKSSFVRKINAAVRTLDPARLDARTKKALAL